MQDDELLAQLRTEPNIGIQILMNQYAGIVYAVVRSKLSEKLFSPTDIEDCVADVFSEFYREIDSFDDTRGSIKAWLCVIAKHNAIDILRKRSKDNCMISLEDADLGIEYADAFSVEDDFEEKELRKRLMQEIKKLGEPDCEIIVRKFYLSQSSKEIAEVLDMTVSNVDVRTHRALKKLRKKLGGEQRWQI